jgi:hypothetical protein
MKNVNTESRSSDFVTLNSLTREDFESIVFNFFMRPGWATFYRDMVLDKELFFLREYYYTLDASDLDKVLGVSVIPISEFIQPAVECVEYNLMWDALTKLDYSTNKYMEKLIRLQITKLTDVIKDIIDQGTSQIFVTQYFYTLPHPLAARKNQYGWIGCLGLQVPKQFAQSKYLGSNFEEELRV